MQDCVAVAKALSDANRLRAMMALRGGELCVCEVIEMLGLAPSTVSKHMTVLRQAGLVASRKEGRWVYYRLPEPPAACVRGALGWVAECLAADPQVREDAQRLKAIRRMSKEDLCRCYRTAAS
jgi:ArsR family transcriptional regulator